MRCHVCLHFASLLLDSYLKHVKCRPGTSRGAEFKTQKLACRLTFPRPILPALRHPFAFSCGPSTSEPARRLVKKSINNISQYWNQHFITWLSKPILHRCLTIGTRRFPKNCLLSTFCFLPDHMANAQIKWKLIMVPTVNKVSSRLQINCWLLKGLMKTIKNWVRLFESHFTLTQA